MQISVIIPAYNTHMYIEQCIDSIAAQDYFKRNNYEIILGIDGCKETLKKVKRIRHKYPKLRILWFKKNQGCYIVTNTLISVAKYRHIQKFDSDDWMETHMVRTMVENIGSLDAILPLCYKVRDDKILKITWHPNSILIKKKTYKKLGGYCAWRCAADGEFLNRLRKFCNIKTVEEPLFYYRKHSTSLTKSRETSGNSPLRKQYHRLGAKIHRDDTVYIKPEISKYKEL